MEKEKLYRKVEATGLISGIIKGFYDDVVAAPKEGKKVCWCVGAGPYELFKAQDIAHFQTENWAVAISARKMERLLISVTRCSSRKGRYRTVCRRNYAFPNLIFSLPSIPVHQWRSGLRPSVRFTTFPLSL
jgi:hypothetical protein